MNKNSLTGEFLIDPAAGRSLRDRATSLSAAALQATRADDSDGDNGCGTLCPQMVGSVAVVPVVGTLWKYADVWMRWLGGTSTLQLKNLISALVDDEAVTGIVLYVDSPGGMVAGVSDAGDVIRNSTKPIIGVASDAALSGGYWLLSQCSKIFANPTALIGSIGVYMVLSDTSELYSNAGIKNIMVKDGARKGIGEDGVPISDEDVESKQVVVSDISDLFKGVVTRARTLTVPIDEAATGEAFIASKAKAMGLIDEIGGLDDAIALFTKDMTMSNLNNVAGANQAQAQNAATGAAAATAPAPTVVIDPTAVANAKQEGFLAGVAKAREDFKTILQACDGRADIAASSFAAGHDVAQATAAYAKSLKEENAALKNAQAAWSGGADPVSVVGAQGAGGENDFEAEWNRNEGGCQAKAGGNKGNWIAMRKWQAQQAATGKNYGQS